MKIILTRPIVMGIAVAMFVLSTTAAVISADIELAFDRDLVS